MEFERIWEDVQLVPEREDYWSDSCSCSVECTSSDDYESYSDDTSDTATEADTESSETEAEVEIGEGEPQEDGGQSEALRNYPSWEHLSSECVRQQIRELEDPRAQKEFYEKLGQMCSGIVKSIKRQRVV